MFERKNFEQTSEVNVEGKTSGISGFLGLEDEGIDVRDEGGTAASGFSS
jgi:hypothetical protein